MSVGFEKVYLMQNSANLAVSEVLSTYTYKMGLINLDYGYSSAVGLFNSCHKYRLYRPGKLYQQTYQRNQLMVRRPQ